MSKKILSVLLALTMIVGLFVAIVPEASAEEIENSAGGKDYVYYVSSTGSDSNNGLTAETPFKSFTKAYALAKAVTPTAKDTITIKLSGPVYENQEASGAPNRGAQAFPQGGAYADVQEAVPITVEGITADATLIFVAAAAADSTTRRTAGGLDLYFKNLDLAVADYFNNNGTITKGKTPNVYSISVGASTMTFDGVEFLDRPWRSNIAGKTDITDEVYDALPDVTWRLYCRGWSGSINTANATSAPYYNRKMARMVFLNGDYTNLDDVSPAGVYANNSDMSKNYNSGAPALSKHIAVSSGSSATKTSWDLFLNAQVVIGEGAQMGTVSAVNWNAMINTVSVVVKDGAQVENLYGAGPDAFKVDAPSMAVYVLVEEGAEVENLQTYAMSNWDGSLITSATVNTCIVINDEVNGEQYVNGEYQETPVADLVFYAGGTGATDCNASGNSGFAPDYPTLYLNDIFYKLEGLPIRESDTVQIQITGSVMEHNAYVGGQALLNGSNRGGFQIPTTVEIVGQGNDAEVVFYALNAFAHASTRRTACHDTAFRNLKIDTSYNKSDAGLADNTDVFVVGIAAGSLHFDNVVFADGVKWILSLNGNLAFSSAAAKQMGGTEEDPVIFQPILEFKNGDYSNLYTVMASTAPAMDTAIGDLDYTLVNGYLSPDGNPANYVKQGLCSVNNGRLIIDNAVMGVVDAAGWEGKGGEVFVEIKNSSEVATLNVAKENFNLIENNSHLNITIDDSSMDYVNVVHPHQANALFGGSYTINGAQVVMPSFRFAVDSKFSLVAEFDKDDIDAIADDFNILFYMGTKVLFQGDFNDLQVSAQDPTVYQMVIPGLNPDQFNTTISFGGNGIRLAQTTVAELAEKAKTAWAGNDKMVALAESVLALAGNEDLDVEIPESEVSFNNEEGYLKGYGLYLADATGLYLNFNTELDLSEINVSVKRFGSDFAIVEDGAAVANFCRFDATSGKLIVFVHAASLSDMKLLLEVSVGGETVATFNASVVDIAAAYANAYAGASTDAERKVLYDAKALLLYADAAAAL